MSTRSKRRAASPAKESGKKAAASSAPPAKKSKSSTSAAAASAASSSTAADFSLPVRGPTLPAGSKGEVFALGSGDCSQLGLGAEENVRERKKPTLIKSLADRNILAIAAGSLHNLVLDSDRAVWSWGCNDDAALGRETDEWLPEPVEGILGQGVRASEDAVAAASNGVETSFDGVVQIACGASHSVALTADGVVYAWGAYRDAQGLVGFDSLSEMAKVPRKMETLNAHKQKVIMIAAGEHHDLALTASGQVFQWGDIGIGRRFSDRTKKTKLAPRSVSFKKVAGVPAPKKIEAIYAGGHSCFALDKDGKAWFWGPNNYNQGGIINENKNELMILVPTPVPNLPPLSKIACATHHTLFLTRDHEVYSVGRGEDGRLGHGDSKNYETPRKIDALSPSTLGYGDKVVDINVGESHSFAVTQLGRVYSFGYGDLLQLGNGVEEDVATPYWVRSQQLDDAGEAKLGRQVVQASGGAQHSILLAVARKQPAPWAKPADGASNSSSSAAAAQS